MPKYIDIEKLQFEPDPWGGMNGVLFVGRSAGKTIELVKAALKHMIQNAPTVDAVEVVHGRNVREDTPSLFECSICGWTCMDTCPCDTGIFNYCPNCGAKMDGEGNG